MNFGEKLYALRKEKGYSQEELAQKMNTTRQAISKWETSQGFPETEKLMQLSNIFEVSLDYLLKEEVDTRCSNEKGYYVSKEMAQSYIAHEKRCGRYVSIGFMFWASSGIPYVMLQGNTMWMYLSMSILIIMGVISIVLAMFSQDSRFDVIKEEPLLFDQGYIKDLLLEYQRRKKSYRIIWIPCTVLFVISIVVLAISAKGYIEWTTYHSFIFLALAIGLLGFSYCACMSDAYEILVYNDKYCAKLHNVLKRRIKQKIRG